MIFQNVKLDYKRKRVALLETGPFWNGKQDYGGGGI